MGQRALGYADIPAELREHCDSITISVTLADPNVHDMPLLYVNPAFEEMTQYSAAEAIGKNCRFLQGPFTDRLIISDLAVSLDRLESDICCVVNYKRDGTPFLNLLAVRPIVLRTGRTFIMGCNFAFHQGAESGILEREADRIDHAIRQLRNNLVAGRKKVTELETYRLDSISMRFGAAFLNVENKLIATEAEAASERWANLKAIDASVATELASRFEAYR